MLIGSDETANAVAAVPFAPVDAEKYGLPPADRRWFYAYRLSDLLFRRLQQDLMARRRIEELATGKFPAMFVLWASEWLRRSYRGGGYRWTDLVTVLGIKEDQDQLRNITARGLRAWGRPVIAGANSREYLGSLAREGGFPAAAIVDGGRGWALDVLKAIVAQLLAEPNADDERAWNLAVEQRLRLPQVFRDDAFVALCGDLALAIVQLRHEVDRRHRRILIGGHGTRIQASQGVFWALPWAVSRDARGGRDHRDAPPVEDDPVRSPGEIVMPDRQRRGGLGP